MNEIIIGLIIAVGGLIINFIVIKIYNKVIGRFKNFIWRN